ncbi:hypothetical protein AXF42_Ash005160 [Apostasia shenzhenica]|uniref:Uncharacterized protein n=1 Tax=Apostasia shenzhenica TaxID=1088818 RepID=A0A2I0B8L8_9ASPA|nr:hypothetical protein AXF42_Ash005160 [Apostasia shenzhenica]
MASPPFSASGFTVRDVLSFHKLDRGIYERLLSFGLQPVTARNVTALWMGLELIGIDVIAAVKDRRDPAIVGGFIAEAESILDYLRQDSPAMHDPSVAGIPLTAALVDEPLTLRFFYAQRNVAVRALTNILDGVGTVVFDDGLNALLRAHEEAVRVAEEAGRPPPPLPVELALPYHTRPMQSEDRRSMFVTFSKGFPLRREDIIEYFSEYVDHYFFDNKEMGGLRREGDDGEDDGWDAADVRSNRIQERVANRVGVERRAASEVYH